MSDSDTSKTKLVKCMIQFTHTHTKYIIISIFDQNVKNIFAHSTRPVWTRLGSPTTRTTPRATIVKYSTCFCGRFMELSITSTSYCYNLANMFTWPQIEFELNVWNETWIVSHVLYHCCLIQTHKFCII